MHVLEQSGNGGRVGWENKRRRAKTLWPKALRLEKTKRIHIFAILWYGWRKADVCR